MVARRMKNNQVSPNLLRFLLGLYVLASFCYWLTGTLDDWTRLHHPEQHVQVPFDYDKDTLVIGKLQPEAKKAGAIEGATLVSLNGVAYAAGVWDEIINSAHPDDMMDVGFKRKDGSIGAATITLAVMPPLAPYIPRTVLWVEQILLVFLVVPICLGMGYWVVLAKPTDGNAWLLLILLTFPSVFFLTHHGFGAGLT